MLENISISIFPIDERLIAFGFFSGSHYTSLTLENMDRQVPLLCQGMAKDWIPSIYHSNSILQLHGRAAFTLNLLCSDRDADFHTLGI